ncbi:MAG: hypothetical protein JWR50_2366 [Mucilaginibacter sp.]|nr:hypothetical protein [Mucilaginibacter sp.]
MKKTLLIAFCLSLFLFSCKKSEAPKNTVTLSVDGANKKYSVGAVATIGDYIAEGSNLFLAGYTNENNIAESIQITISANSSIAKGVYRNDGKNGALRIIYYPSDYTLAKQNSYITDLSGIYESTVTITSISNSNVQGTFSGQLVLNGGNTVKTISDGKFNVNIQH